MELAKLPVTLRVLVSWLHLAASIHSFFKSNEIYVVFAVALTVSCLHLAALLRQWLILVAVHPLQ